MHVGVLPVASVRACLVVNVYLACFSCFLGVEGVMGCQPIGCCGVFFSVSPCLNVALPGRTTWPPPQALAPF